MLIVGGNQSAGGYDVDNSLRFNDGSDDSLTRAFPSAGNQRTWTFSTWVKRAYISNANMNILGTDYAGSGEAYFLFRPGDRIQYGQYEGGGTVGNYRLELNNVFRDSSAWYHFTLVWDTTDATSSDRIRIYVNGVRQTSAYAAVYPALNYQGVVNQARTHYIGDAFYGTNLDGYLAETVFIDGQALEPTSFGEFDEDSGIWKPIDVSGLTFGTNGFYLPFENSAALGQDDSGNGNNFTVNNLTSIDQTTDTPTNNGVVLNNLYSSSGTGFSEGNLNYTNSPAAWKSALSTIAPNQGKWYVEFKKVSGTYAWFGVTGENLAETISNFWLGSDNGSSGTNIAWGSQSGNVESNGVNLGFFGGSMADGTIVGIALDLDNDYIYFSKNGTFINSGDPTSGASGTGGFALPNRVALEAYMIGVSSYSGSVLSCNFGSPSYTISSGNSDADGYGNFEYAVPSGYYAINSKNLAEFG